CTSRSRVRAEVMPMPEKRTSATWPPVEPLSHAAERRMARQVDLQRRDRHEALADGVEIGTRPRFLPRAGRTDPEHRPAPRVARAADRLGAMPVTEARGATGAAPRVAEGRHGDVEAD